MKTFLKARWDDIVMVNYEVDPSVLIPYLPFGTQIDIFDNKAFVSLVGFKFAQSKIFGAPMPFFGTFDEVNLRFYVKRKDGNEFKRGVVFISEVVPYKAVSFLANKLYKEHYSFAKMKSEMKVEGDTKLLQYNWKPKLEEYSIKVALENTPTEIVAGSLEEFIYEHYYGFTKVNPNETWQYKVNHPRWKVNAVKTIEVNCDFEKMYGSNFEFLNTQKPYSTYNAIGSEVSIGWKITKIKN
jgi:uncharacterized protein YqjF (DUF2071 family)